MEVSFASLTKLKCNIGFFFLFNAVGDLFTRFLRRELLYIM